MTHDTKSSKRDRVRFAKAAIKTVKKDKEIPPVKAIEELTRCIIALQSSGEWYSAAEALHLRGCAAACGMENHRSAFRDWKRALHLIFENKSVQAKALRLAAHIRFYMGLHSEGATRMRHYNQSLALCRVADWPRGEALVIVHRGLAWKERGESKRAVRDLEEGLRLARLHRMGEIKPLKRFISEAYEAARTP